MERKKVLTGLILTFILASITAYVSAQASIEETGTDTINITTDVPTNIKETEATFQATLNGFDQNDLDAALIFWNYSTDSSLDQKGAAMIASQEQQHGQLTSGLSPDTTYNVEAYAEPIVWNDQTILDNFLSKFSREGLALSFAKSIGDETSVDNYESVYPEFNETNRATWMKALENNPSVTPTPIAPDLTESYTQTGSISFGLEADDVSVSPDGTKFIVGGVYDGHKVYTMSDPWNVSTASVSSTDDFGYTNVFMGPEGKNLIVGQNGYQGDGMKAYELSTAWDLSTATQTSSMTANGEVGDMYVTPDGSKLIVGIDYGTVESYNLSTPWDLNTASYITDTSVGDPSGVDMSSDGSKLLVGDATVNAYNLSQPWDISTASGSTASISTSGSSGMAVSPDGRKILTSWNDCCDGGVYSYSR